MRSTIALLCLVIHIVSCRSSQLPKSDNAVCFAFDIRQCQTDTFAKEVSEHEPKALRETNMLQWLQSKEVEAVSVDLKIDFYDGVCEACDMCPTPDVYVVNATGPLPEMDDLRLLNFRIVDCQP